MFARFAIRQSFWRWPSILKLLRDKGNGKLFGLSPTFNSSALYDNIDLFQKYGVEPPTDSMSWDEVLKLAKRFPTDGSEKDRIYGFSTQSHSSVFDMVWTISRTNGLRILNPDATQVTLAGDGWKRVLQTVVDAVKSKAVLIPDPQNPGNAMTMEDSPTGWSILQATSSARYRRS